MLNQALAYLPLGLDPLHEQHAVLNSMQIDAAYLIVSAVPVSTMCPTGKDPSLLSQSFHGQHRNWK